LPPRGDSEHDAAIAKWQEAVYEIAMRELLADEAIHQRSKQIFLRLAVDGASPEEVASAYGVSRNVVDKIKSRMIARLKEIVVSLGAVDETE
jgi:DNA-directed RNA polymerase specialized sigma24 family protein